MLNTKGKKAVVAGHICLDITPNFEGAGKKELKDILMPGKLINVSGVKVSLGGAVPNTGLALSVLGIDTSLMGKVGGDYFGEGILRLLKERSVDKGMIVVDGAQTSYTVIIVPPGTDRIFLHDPGANDTFEADDINYEIVQGAGLFHFGYPPIMKKTFENDGDELVKIFKRVKELGVTTSLDMCLPDPASEAGGVNWGKLLEKVLPYVDIFIPSIEETIYMVDREYYKQLREMSNSGDVLDNLDMGKVTEIGHKLCTYGAKILVLKCGLKGYYILTQGESELKAMGRAKPADLENWAHRELLEETFKVSDVVSTTGSGDTSIAGFLAAFLNGSSIEEALKMACAVGAECVQTFDAISGIKTFDETRNMLSRGWGKNRVLLDSCYWSYDDRKQVWTGKHDKLYGCK